MKKITYSTQLNSTENYGRGCLTPLSPHRNYILSYEQYHFMTSSDRFPEPVRSAVKSNFTDCCCQNLISETLETSSWNPFQFLLSGSKHVRSVDKCATFVAILYIHVILFINEHGSQQKLNLRRRLNLSGLWHSSFIYVRLPFMKF